MGRKEYEGKKRRDIASFVRDGEVDWQRWNALRGSDNSYNDALKEGVISHLEGLGILSPEPEGNHRITGSGGLNLGPKQSRMIETYFTDREQARAYVRACFSETQYSIRIEKLIDVEHVS